ncbi:MAG: hypothetical protein AAFO82_08525 [Bacteroidota bacterium]
MKNSNIKTILIWLPSVVVSMIYIQNGLEKIFHPDQQDKVVNNTTLFIIVGVILLIATVLFLNNKTILWGTTILAFYMTLISLIHWYKGKPFEVVVLIVMCTIFAAYLRQPHLFHRKNES